MNSAPGRRRTPKGQGVREAERPRMAVLSDLLGFPHHTCARGSTVKRAFLEDLARALGEPDPSALRKKDDVLVAAASRATGRQVQPSEVTSEGETVKNSTLDLIIDAVMARGLTVPSARLGGTAARIAANLAESGRADADAALEALDLSDERRRSLRQSVVREGQGRFRSAVLHAYGGCAVTGTLTEAALDAAHIRPYAGPRSSSVRNGICLRADLHRLWDRGLLAVHERTHTVLVHAAATDTAYQALHGSPVRLPAKPGQWPLDSLLAEQRQWCGL